MNLKNIYSSLLLIVLCAAPFTLSAQYFDYHRDESPSISWNGVPLFDARMLGAGGVSLMASPAFSASINPALIPSTKETALGASYEIMQHEAFQYRGLNQGVFYSPDNQSQRNDRPSGFAIVFPYKGLRFSAGWSTINLLELPSFSFQADRYSYTGNFPGNENTVFAAAAFKLSQSVDVGIKLEYVYGKRDVDVNEDLIVDVILLQLRESHRLSYFVPTIGVAVKLSPVWRLGAAWVHPLRGNVDRTLDQVFESNFERIVVSGLENKDSLYRPARLYLGTTLEPFANPAGKESKKTSFTIAAEAVYALWSQYKYEFYSEFLERDMRNTLVLALGMELGLLKRNGGFFARLGYRMDPQPVTRPETTLHALTGGLGIRLGQVSLDVGGMYYYGSIDDFSQQHLVFNATLQIALGK